MRKIISLAVVFAFTITMASAQTFKIGPVGGVNFNKISVNPDTFRADQQGWKIGARGGLALSYPLGEMVSIHQEILFSQKGSSTEDKTEFQMNGTKIKIEEETDLTLNYLEMPLQLRFNFGDPTDKQFFFNFGPRVGFLLGGSRTSAVTTKFEPDNGNDDGIEEQSHSGIDEEQYENAEFGIDFGLGYDINTGPGHVMFELRGGWGLTDIRTEQPVEDFYTKNRTVSLTVSYLFGNEK